MSEVSAFRPKALAPDDLCGCKKAEGCWGAHGWHWTRFNRTMLETRAVNNWHAQGLPEEEFEFDERDMTYAGLPVAYERCKRYVAGVESRRPSRQKKGPEY